MVCRRKYSVPQSALWPISIMGSAGPCFDGFYEALTPFSPLFLRFRVPNLRRLPRTGVQGCVLASCTGLSLLLRALAIRATIGLLKQD
jgi:hypothetical protein